MKDIAKWAQYRSAAIFLRCPEGFELLSYHLRNNNEETLDGALDYALNETADHFESLINKEG